LTAAWVGFRKDGTAATLDIEDFGDSLCGSGNFTIFLGFDGRVISNTTFNGDKSMDSATDIETSDFMALQWLGVIDIEQDAFDV